MACQICGERETVRSHIVPKRFALDVREDAKHGIMGSIDFDGARATQGGVYCSEMLCARCENVTADLDRYGFDFVSRANANWRPAITSSYEVLNPEPQTLGRFIVATIWRECHSSRPRSRKKSLGVLDSVAASSVFDAAPVPWPIFVSLDRWSGGMPGRSKLIIYPFRTRFQDRIAWMVTLSSVTFYLIVDGRGLRFPTQGFEAQRDDPVIVVVMDEAPLDGVPILQPLFARMRKQRN
jgi:hypothetical protein